MRAYKTVNDSYIEPISFTVPRRAEVFQSDIYPPAIGLKPAVSASEWLSGKDGLPAKIDLESIYEGNAPVEVPADYKPPTPAPAPSAAPAPASEKKASEPVPVAVQRAPPPTISEQKGSIAAIASKFQDDEAEDDDDDETSSFEEISRPVQKSTPVVAQVESKSIPPIKTSPTKTSPPKPSPVSQATPKSMQPPAASPTPTTIPTSSGPISAVGSAPSSSSNGSVEASLAQIKSLLETQTKTITIQSEKIEQLVLEVDTLKMRVGSGTQDQSERIRQLELELEAARS